MDDDDDDVDNESKDIDEDENDGYCETKREPKLKKQNHKKTIVNSKKNYSFNIDDIDDKNDHDEKRLCDNGGQDQDFVRNSFSDTNKFSILVDYYQIQEQYQISSHNNNNKNNNNSNTRKNQTICHHGWDE